MNYIRAIVWETEQHLRKAKEVSEQSDLTPKPPFIASFSIESNAKRL